ncbi:MAG: hypothetical protein R3C14_50015 [Caldilineaceae bacterium]
MAKINVFHFLQDLAEKPDLLAELRTLPKTETLARANQAGYAFSENDFDDAIWGIEIYLAKKLGETFDFSFSLWETMWGKHYLDYLVDNVVGAITHQDIEAFLHVST